MRHLLTVLLASLATLAAFAAPAKLGAWAGNGRWSMRATEVKVVDSLQAFQALPWTARLTGAEREKLFRYAENSVYKRQQKLVLARVECKNASKEKQKIGYSIPMWTLRCTDGQEIRNNGSQVQTVSFTIQGGMPKETLLNPGATAGGWLAFFVPVECQPKLVFFQAPGVLAKTYGETESVVMLLTK